MMHSRKTSHTRAAAGDPREPNSRGLLSVLRWEFLALLVLVMASARQAPWQLNTDAVAYLRLAEYWSDGRFELAVSGYWGPLLSWLLAPWLGLGMPALFSARLVMAISAVVFWVGCESVFRVFGLRAQMARMGLWLAALAAALWSAQFITPDLLLAGLVGLAAARLLNHSWPRRFRVQFAAGVLLGLSYLAKPVGFPLGLLLIGTGILRWIRSSEAGRGAVVRAGAITGLVFAVVAAPWCATLSLKYGRPTFSTGARIAHAVVGPPDVDRYHPTFRTIHRPEAGRITSWEDPSRMPYRFWSPLESGTHLQHQAAVIGRNLVNLMILLTSLSLVWPWLLLRALDALRTPKERTHLVREPSAWAFAFIGVMTVIYLPAYVEVVDQRYLYAAWPFLFVAAASSLGLGSDGVLAVAPGKAGWRHAVLGLSFATPALAGFLWLLLVDKPATREATTVAKLLWVLERPTQVRPPVYGPASGPIGGPIVGSGSLPGGRAGLYLAYFLNQPWYGDQVQPSAESYRRSGARFAVARRGSEIARELEHDPSFRRLGQDLPAVWLPGMLEVFELIAPDGPATLPPVNPPSARAPAMRPDRVP